MSSASVSASVPSACYSFLLLFLRRRTPARRIVGLDINGTVMEGDTFHGNLGDAALTQPVINLASHLEQCQPTARILLYTMGIDWRPVKEQLTRRGERWSFPAHNHLFIARATQSEEIWAFAMPVVGDDATAHVDFSVPNPTIRLAAPSEVALISSENELRGASSPFRFAHAQVFAAFVDGLLDAGDVVFRAAFDPSNPYFSKRGSGKPPKVLCSAADVIAFDDNHGDWELLPSPARARQAVMHALTPDLASRLNQGNESEKVRQMHELSRTPSGRFEPTDMVAAVRAAF